VILFQHGIGGHLEAYCKNLVPLAGQFRTIAFDYVGHALSARKAMEYTPLVAGGAIARVDWMRWAYPRPTCPGSPWAAGVSVTSAMRYPDRVDRLMLNTGAGIPIVSDKGRTDMAKLMELSKKAVALVPTFDSVKARIQWLIHPDNHHLITDELVELPPEVLPDAGGPRGFAQWSTECCRGTMSS